MTMKKTRRTTGILLCICLVLLLAGCGGQKQTKEDSKPVQQEKQGGSDTAPSSGDDQTVPWELEYVDAYGEHFTAVINPELKMHDYDWTKLVREGESVISYEGDENYSIRKGVDVAVYQGDIDWAALKEAGFEFAFIRIAARAYGEKGQLLEDQAFEQNINGAQAAGLDVGVYFFSQAVSEEEALEEAQMTVQMLEGHELQLPVVFDPETIRDDEARTDHVSGKQFTDNTIAFCEQIKSAGFEPMVYSNMVWEDQFFEMERLQDYPFWYADYEKAPQTPYDFRFWQYTEKGEAPGVSGTVDLDVEFVRK